MAEYNWGIIHDGGTFESLMHALLGAEDDSIILFGRPGKDAGQDARSGDGKTVYQAKYQFGMKMTNAIKLALDELKNIKLYRQESHPNHQHWVHAKQWVLVGNFTINPNDDAKWKEKVVPAFRKEGLEATYWDEERLNSLLYKHPSIASVFFEGRTRVFLGLKEAWDGASDPEKLGFAEAQRFDIPMVGRESQMEALEAFAKSEKRILPVVASAGLGKTRFLLEAMKRMSQQDWRVLWGCEASMTSSDRWFPFLNGNQPTLVVLDEPADLRLLRILCEQLRATERRRWKVLVALKPVYEDVLDVVRTYGMAADPLDLPPLTEETSRELVLSIPGASLDNTFAYQAFQYTGGIPSWLVLLSGLADDTKFPHVPVRLDEAVSRIMKSFLQSGPQDNPEEGRAVLHWLALWGVLSVEEDIDDFEMGTIAKGRVRLWLQAAERHHLAWPDLKGNYVIINALLREFLLRGWLLQGESSRMRMTMTGVKLLRQLAEGSLPRRKEGLSALASLTAAFVAEEVRPSLWEPVFAWCEKEAANPEFEPLRELISLLKDIGHVDPERALEVWGTVLKTVKLHQDNPPVDPAWRILYPRPNGVFSSVSALTSHIKNPVLMRRFFKFFQDHAEDTSKQSNVMDFSLTQMLTKNSNWETFFEAAARFVEDRMRSNSQYRFTQNLIRFLQQPRLPYHTVECSSAINFCEDYIVPGSTIWKHMLNIRRDMREYASEADDISFSRMLWQLLGESHTEFSFTMTRIPELYQQAYRQVLVDDFRVCEDYLRSLSSLPLAVACSLRGIWEWQLKFGQDTELNAQAQACEQLFEQKIPWNFHRLFTLATEKELGSETALVAKRLRKSGDPEVLRRFFEDAAAYMEGDTALSNINDPCFRMSALANLLYEECNPLSKDTSCFGAPVVREALDGRLNELAYVFAVCIAQRCLREGKATPAPGEERLRQLLELAEDKKHFLGCVYGRSTAVDPGPLTGEELACLREQERLFSDAEWFFLMGSFAHLDWPGISQNLDRRLDSLGNGTEQSISCLQSFLTTRWCAFIKNPEWLDVNHVNWLIAAILCRELGAALFDNFMLKKLRNHTQNTLGVEQVVTVWKTSSTCRELFSFSRKQIKGTDIGSWCGYDYGNRRYRRHFVKLCKFALDKEYAAYIPRAVMCFDPTGEHTLRFIRGWLNKHQDAQPSDMALLARLASGFDRNTATWQAMALIFCERCDSYRREQRHQIYHSLHYVSLSGLREEVEQAVQSRKDQAEEAIHNLPKDDIMREYWEYELEQSVLKADRVAAMWKEENQRMR